MDFGGFWIGRGGVGLVGVRGDGQRGGGVMFLVGLEIDAEEGQIEGAMSFLAIGGQNGEAMVFLGGDDGDQAGFGIFADGEGFLEGATDDPIDGMWFAFPAAIVEEFSGGVITDPGLPVAIGFEGLDESGVAQDE